MVAGSPEEAVQQASTLAVNAAFSASQKKCRFERIAVEDAEGFAGEVGGYRGTAENNADVVGE